MARRRRPVPGATTQAMTGDGRNEIPPPPELMELYVSDWIRPGEQPPPPRHQYGDGPGEADAWLWQATTTLTRHSRARAAWAQAQGMDWWAMARRYPKAWAAPRRK
jgi:hypothetical protein